MPVTIKRSGSLEKAFEKLGKRKKTVLVGIINKRNQDGKSLAEIGTYLEYGWVQQVTGKQAAWFAGAYNLSVPPGASLYMPPRPFMRATFTENIAKWTKIGGNALGKYRDINLAARLLGQVASEDIRATIRNNGTGSQKFAERSDLTMEMLSRDMDGHHPGRGKNVSQESTSTTRKALMRTGTLEKSISFEILDE